MLLQFCDKCGRPLSEGALARGEAIERDGDTICTLCLEKERLEQVAKARIEAIQAHSTEPRPLAQYEKAVWNCISCGIPVNALDLIEGRATRTGHRVECIRCRNSAVREEPPPAVAMAVASHTAPSVTKPPSARRPAVAVPRAGSRTVPRPVAPRAAEAFIAGARKEQSRPILPILLITIILPMFAVSVWFAVQYQQRLSDLADQANQQLGKSRRDSGRETPPVADGGVTRKLPDDPPQPAPKNPSPMPTKDGTGEPSSREPEGLPRSIAEELANIERELAAPILKQLQSRECTEVWEGLLAAGSRRLVGTRAQVRALLEDPDARTRAIACRVTAMLGDNAALARLETLAERDPAEEVRDAAHLARSRLLGRAARELKDLTPEELETLKKEVEDQIKRHGGGGRDG